MTTNAKFCPECRKILVPGASFCAYCGTRLEGGGVRREPRARSRVIALPSEQALAAPCSVVAADERFVSIPELGRLLSAMLKRPLSDVTREMRVSRGVLAQGLPVEQALSLARGLKESGVEAFVLGGEDFVEPPELQRMRRLELDRRGVRCEAYTWTHTRQVEAEWDRVFLIAAGRVATTEVVEVPREEPTPAERRWRWIAAEFQKHVPKLETRVRVEYVLDIVLFDPWERLRMDENPSAYAMTGAEADQRSALVEAAAGLSRFDRGAPCNQGVELLAHMAPAEAWQGLTFQAKQEFDAYLRWALQLARYGFSIPR